MKTHILAAAVTLAFAIVAHAQTPSTHSGNYGPDRVNDSAALRNIGSFSTSASNSQPATFLATVEYNISDISNDSDIQGFLYVDGGSIAHAVDRIPGTNISSRQSVMTLIGQATLSPGNHSVVVQIGRVGSVDAYDVNGRWVCTVVKYGESSIALTNAVSALQEADASMQAALQAQIDALAALAAQETAALQSQINTLNGQIASLEEHAEYLERRMQLQESYTDVIEAELDLVHFQIQSLQNEVASHQQWLADHEARLAALEQTLAETNAQLAATQSQLTETQGALTQTQSDLAATQGSLTDTQNQLTETQGALTQTQSDLGITQGNLAQTQSDLAGTQSTLAGVQNDLVGTQSGLTVAQEDIVRLQNEAIQNANAAIASNQHFRETITLVRDRLGENSVNTRELEQQIAGLPSQRDYNGLLEKIEQMPGQTDYRNVLERVRRIPTQSSDEGTDVGAYVIPIGVSLGGSFLMDMFFNNSDPKPTANLTTVGSSPASSSAVDPSTATPAGQSLWFNPASGRQSIPYKH